MLPSSSSRLDQFAALLLLALPVACVAWTVVKEEIFREPRECAERLCERPAPLWQRKFFYVFTCEYCFSHYVAAGLVALTGFRLLFDDWRGYLIAWLALVAVANVYLSAYTRLRVDIRKERGEADIVQNQADNGQPGPDNPSASPGSRRLMT